MNQELKTHLIPLTVIFVLFSLVWFVFKAPYYNFIFLFLGLGIGSFFLDLDHVVYWLYLKPNLEESRLAQIAISKKDFHSVVKLLESTHKTHTSLIFHHYFFQVVLGLVSLFVFTSSESVFGKAFLSALNIHLLVDEIYDFRNNPAHLQDWLFAREPKQLSGAYLKYYLGFFILLSLVFLAILLKSI